MRRHAEPIDARLGPLRPLAARQHQQEQDAGDDQDRRADHRHYHGRRLRRGLFRSHATDPGQVASLPQVGEADEQHAEKDEDFAVGDPP